MPPALFNQLVTLYRRTSTATDALGNPTYGVPVTGAGWSVIYTNMPVKLAFSAKQIQFAMTGERPEPTGIVYCGASYIVLPEDRIVTAGSTIQYVVVSVVPAYSTPNTIDHWEIIVSLPT
jgi:hypothetical protein